jgi:hypothetical protein
MNLLIGRETLADGGIGSAKLAHYRAGFRTGSNFRANIVAMT